MRQGADDPGGTDTETGGTSELSVRHIYQCPLRWSDMDAFGHVNNVVYLRYLEEARIDFMWRHREEPGTEAGSGADPEDGSASGGGEEFAGGTVVARHEIDYLRPLVHRYETVTIETWVTKINAASATLAYEVKDADTDTVYARATTIIVPYNLMEERPRRLTAEERAFLEGYFDDSAEESRLR